MTAVWRICWLVSLGLASFLPADHATRAHTSNPGRYAVIIVLDGARPNYFDAGHMPHFAWLLRHGTTYTRAFVGQVEATTPTSHATIGTGLFPKHHGVQGFEWKDPRTGMPVRPSDTPSLLRGALEQVLSQHRVPSIAAAMKDVDARASILSVTGHKCYAADAMGTPAADFILCALIYHSRWVAQAVGTHRPPPGAINNPAWDVHIPPPDTGFAPAVEQWRLTQEDGWTVRYALWAFNRIKYPRVMMINLPETDVIGHFATDNSRAEAALMQAFDRSLGRIMAAYRQAGILQRTVFLVTSDHGMSRIDVRLPFAILDRAIRAAGATKVYLEADTGAAIGIRQLDRARTVAVNVAKLGGDAIDATYYKTFQHGRWYYLPAAAMARQLSPALRNAYVTLLNTAASPESPDVFAVYAPHVTTGDRPVNGYHWLAGHLGPQWDEQQIPLLIAGSGVRRGFTSAYPARLVDIAPTVEHLLGAPVGPTEGVVLQDALRAPSQALSSAQRRVQASLLPLIRALQERSR